jgi:hypothetical protein
VLKEFGAISLLLIVGERSKARVEVLLRARDGDVEEACLVLDCAPVAGRVVERVVRDYVLEEGEGSFLVRLP